MGLELFFTAFLDLSSCRSLGFGEGPVPWLAIQRYSEINEIDGEQREDLFYHVKELDRAYLDWRSKKLEKS